MLRILAATVLLTMAASPSWACDWNKVTSTATPATTAAAQPAPPANCPTCVVPDQTTGTPQTNPAQPKAS
jgi:hypothetical protein